MLLSGSYRLSHCSPASPLRVAIVSSASSRAERVAHFVCFANWSVCQCLTIVWLCVNYLSIRELIGPVMTQLIGFNSTHAMHSPQQGNALSVGASCVRPVALKGNSFNFNSDRVSQFGDCFRQKTHSLNVCYQIACIVSIRS